MLPTLLGVLGLVFLTGCSDASFVDQVTVVNEGDFPAEVQVAGAGRSRWLAMGLVQDDAERSFREVIDQGETWIFRFDYLDRHREEVEISRSELEQTDWTVTVPDEFESALRQMGLTPPP